MQTITQRQGITGFRKSNTWSSPAGLTYRARPYLGNWRLGLRNDTIRQESIMRRIVLSLAAAILCAASLLAQQSATPQTARQALIEMFFSKTPGTFAKHLPVAMTTAFAKSGAMASLQSYSLLASQIQTQGHDLQTFDTGSVLLSADDPKTGQKVEITVENDSLRGEQDDIDVTFLVYKNGQAQASPFMPQVTFSMKQETQVWKLNEISVTIHVPLADPEFLKALTEKMTQTTQAGTSGAGVSGSFAPRPEVSAQPGGAGSDAMVVAAVRTILTAEVTYARTYPNVGYTCTLSTLDGFGGGEPTERQAMLINSGLASGKRFGYVFTLSECTGTHASVFHLTAAPNGNAFGRKAFCSDQSGIIRSSEDGNAASCIAGGSPLQ